MNQLLTFILSLAITSVVSANTISESQQKWISKYKKQKTIPTPEEMLINQDSEPDLSKGFVDLYNGKNLEGWSVIGGTCTFEAKENSIAGTCIKGSPSTYLTTDKNDYADFIFTAEIKWEVDMNSGIMIRSQTKKSKKGPTALGPQCELEAPSKKRYWSGGIYGQGCGGWFYPLWLDAHKEARLANYKEGWNRVTIKAEGESIKTWINGKPAAHWKTSEFLKGAIGLQVHSGKQGLAHFRNLKIKEL